MISSNFFCYLCFIEAKITKCLKTDFCIGKGRTVIKLSENQPFFYFFKYFVRMPHHFPHTLASSVMGAFPSKLFVFPCWNQGNASSNIHRHKEWMAHSIATVSFGFCLDFFRRCFSFQNFIERIQGEIRVLLQSLSSHFKNEVLIWKKTFPFSSWSFWESFEIIKNILLQNMCLFFPVPVRVPRGVGNGDGEFSSNFKIESRIFVLHQFLVSRKSNDLWTVRFKDLDFESEIFHKKLLNLKKECQNYWKLLDRTKTQATRNSNRKFEFPCSRKKREEFVFWKSGWKFTSVRS